MARLLLALSPVLIAATVAYAPLRGHAGIDLEGCIARRLYFERVITKKGLDLHRAMHWRETK